MQGSYIGNTTASQAVKAGSIPVPCSKKGTTSHEVVPFLEWEWSRTHLNATLLWTVACRWLGSGNTSIFATGENANRLPYPIFQKQALLFPLIVI